MLGRRLPWLVNACLLAEASRGFSSVCVQRERSLVFLPLLNRTPVLSDYSPTILTSFNLNYLPEGPLSITVTFRIRASAYELGGHNSVPKHPLTALPHWAPPVPPVARGRVLSCHLALAPFVSSG